MADDRAVAARGKTPAPVQTSKVGNRGTSTVIYHFNLPVNQDLRTKAEQGAAFEPFHLNVYVLLFGPQVKNTKFVAYRQYATKVRRTQFDDFSGKLSGDIFTYGLNKVVIDWVGLIPRFKPTAISDGGTPPNLIADIDDYSQPMKLNGALNKLPEDVVRIVHAKIGVDISDVRLWKGLDVERQQALNELNAIVTLLEGLDDEAYVALLKNLPKIHKNDKSQTPRLRLWKLTEFRQSLEKLKTKTENRNREGQLLDYRLEQKATSLVGLHILYFSFMEYSDHVEKTGSRHPELEKEGDELLKKTGVSLETLVKLVRDFEKKFEKRASEFARGQLNRYLRLLEFYASRTEVDEMVRDIRAHQGKTFLDFFNKQSLASVTKIQEAIKESNSEYAQLIKKYPIMTYVNFWELFWDAHKSRHSKQFVFRRVMWNVLLSKTRMSIKKTLAELKDPSYIWKGDILANGSLQHFDMYAELANGRTYNAMLTDIVRRKLREEQSSGVIKGIILSIIAIALSLTGVGVLIAVGIVISIIDVYLMIEDQGAQQVRKDAGFSTQDPPSDFWILIAVAGIGVDIGGFVKLLKVGKGVNLANGSKEMAELLSKAENISTKARELIEVASKHKLKLESAITKFKGVASSPGLIGAGATELAEVAYYMARLNLTQFKHFVLELSRRGLIKQIDMSSSYDDIIAKLDGDTLQNLKKAHSKGLGRGVDAFERLKPLDEAVKATERELAKINKKASKIWRQRNKKGVSKNPSNRQSPYNKLKPKHDALIKERERIQRKLSALKSERRILSPPSEKTAGKWGEDVEEATRIQDDWPAMESKTTKSIDSARSAENNTVEVMQHKTIVDPSVADIEKKVKASISETRTSFNGQDYKDLVKQFNENKIPISADDIERNLPINWQDPNMTIYLEIRVLSQTPMDLDSVRKVANELFSKQFPKNAKLNIQNITPEKVFNILVKGA